MRPFRPINAEQAGPAVGGASPSPTWWLGPRPSFYAPNPISGCVVVADGGIEVAPARKVRGPGGAVQAWDGRPARCTGARPIGLADGGGLLLRVSGSRSTRQRDERDSKKKTITLRILSKKYSIDWGACVDRKKKARSSNVMTRLSSGRLRCAYQPRPYFGPNVWRTVMGRIAVRVLNDYSSSSCAISVR